MRRPTDFEGAYRLLASRVIATHPARNMGGGATTREVEVLVPADAKPGKSTLEISIPNAKTGAIEKVSIKVPPHAKPGSRLVFELPTKTRLPLRKGSRSENELSVQDAVQCSGPGPTNRNALQKYRIPVPAGAKPGSTLWITITDRHQGAARKLCVTVPRGAKMGHLLHFTLPGMSESAADQALQRGDTEPSEDVVLDSELVATLEQEMRIIRAAKLDRALAIELT